MIEFMYIVAGFGVGVLLGLTGIGGGALMTPILLLLFGVAPKTAVGTDLLFAAITKLVGVSIHGARGTVDWRIVWRLSVGSLPAAAGTTAVIAVLGHDAPHLDAFLLDAIGIALIVTATGLLLKPRIHALGRKLRLGWEQSFKRAQAPLTVVVGLILGGLVTLTSIGAGALGVAILVYLYPLRLTPVKLAGTDLAHAVPLALVASAGHLAAGNVDFRLLGALLAGSLPGIVLGAWWSTRASEAVLRLLIAATMAVCGIKILWQ
jgi:uncharacterized membrane protein YfcA